MLTLTLLAMRLMAGSFCRPRQMWAPAEKQWQHDFVGNYACSCQQVLLAVGMAASEACWQRLTHKLAALIIHRQVYARVKSSVWEEEFGNLVCIRNPGKQGIRSDGASSPCEHSEGHAACQGPLGMDAAAEARWEAIMRLFAQQNTWQLVGDKPLGWGAYGTVVRAQLPAPVHEGQATHASQEGSGETAQAQAQEDFAIKFVRPSDSSQALHIIGAAVRNEVLLQTLVVHHHIIGLREVIVFEDMLGLKLEFAAHGNMLRRYEAAKALASHRYGPGSHGLLWSEEAAREIVRPLIAALHHCHHLRVVHRDIKLDNMLVADDWLQQPPRRVLKLCDFGFAEQLPAGSNNVLHCKGTPPYMAPEVITALRTGAYDGFKADVWAVGVVLHLLLAGHRPFKSGRTVPPANELLYEGWEACLRPYQLPGNCQLTPHCQSILFEMLAADPRHRPSLSELIGRPWFTKGSEQHGDFARGVVRLSLSLQHRLQQNHASLVQNQQGIDLLLTEMGLTVRQQ